MQSCPQKNPKCRCIVLAWNSLFPTSITLKFYLNQFYVIQLEWRFVFVYHKTKKITYCLSNKHFKMKAANTPTEETVALFLYLIIIWYWDVCCPTFPLNWNKRETRFPELLKSTSTQINTSMLPTRAKHFCAWAKAESGRNRIHSSKSSTASSIWSSRIFS